RLLADFEIEGRLPRATDLPGDAWGMIGRCGSDDTRYTTSNSPFGRRDALGLQEIWQSLRDSCAIHSLSGKDKEHAAPGSADPASSHTNPLPGEGTSAGPD